MKRRTAWNRPLFYYKRLRSGGRDGRDRKEAIDIGDGSVDWEAARAEYLAGGITLKELAQKHGLKQNEVSRRSKEEGWVALKKEEARAGDSGERKQTQYARGSSGDEVKVARRTRRALLQMLERAAKSIPCDATEVKTTAEDGAVKLMKLRDLTAAYKELVGDLPADEDDREARRVVIDV